MQTLESTGTILEQSQLKVGNNTTMQWGGSQGSTVNGNVNTKIDYATILRNTCQILQSDWSKIKWREKLLKACAGIKP